MARTSRDIVRAAALAATLSGAPSTAWTLAQRGDLLASTRAAGAMVGGEPRLGRGVVVHAVVSLLWTAVLAVVLPRRHAVVAGAVAGGAIAALDIGVIAPRRFRAIVSLPRGPVVADHVAFGALVGWSLARSR